LFLGRLAQGHHVRQFRIDDFKDPGRFDRVNWTASNAEIDHMVDKVAFMRESLPKCIELAADMHGRYDVGTGKTMAAEFYPMTISPSSGIYLRLLLRR